MKRFVVATALSTVVLGAVASHAQCPGNFIQASGADAVMHAVPAGSPTLAFVGGSGSFMCPGTPQGAANSCVQFAMASHAYFRAIWPSTAARTMDATGGCVFMCPGGTCRVNSQGLPVELLSFGIQ